MISIDANLLLYAFSVDSPFHAKAQSFLSQLSVREDVALSEFILTEFYLHLRNPAVLKKPLMAVEAVGVIASYRQHPCWQIVGFTSHSHKLHNELWKRVEEEEFPRRRIYDTRTALTLLAHGVREFATANLKDFRGLGFNRVWNPLEE